MITLHAQKRSKTDKLADLRKAGLVPAVVYGAGVENTPISVPAVDFKKVYKEAGETSAISLKVTDSSTQAVKNMSCIIHELQRDPVRGTAMHVDFLSVDMHKSINAHVPVEFVGASEAVKNGVGTLVKVMHEIEVSALPADMPHNIEIDVSALATLDDQILISDIKFPAGVVPVAQGDEVVVSVTPVHEEVESAPLDLSAIEVEKKGKKDEEPAE